MADTLQLTIPGNSGDYTGYMVVGKNNYNDVPYGIIDEVRIWNRALTPDQTVVMKMV